MALAPSLRQTLTVPPLESGDRLDQPEFHRRYEAEPRKFQLVEGVVYMSSPARFDHHMEPQAQIIHWFATYADSNPDVRVGGAGTVILDSQNEPELDAVLLRRSESGGQSRVSPEGYITGAPELAVEISASSVSIDLGPKLQAYQRNGVREYIVWQTFDDVITWFSLEDGVFRPMLPDGSGIVQSKVFPGLRLHVPSMLSGDMTTVLSRTANGRRESTV